MTTATPNSDEIASVAYAIWESEGRPQGRDHEHWTRAIELIREGRADTVLAQSSNGARPVQPGFEDTAPGMVPEPSEAAGDELKEEPGGRFAKQVADAPE